MATVTGGNRWWVYQRERFPLLAHGPLILAFSFSAASYSALARGAAPPPLAAVAVAFATSLLFFLQLRIADEFKDAEEDARYRPYRPVPRGLVTLAELRRIGVAGAVLQLVLAFALDPRLMPLLAVVWVYFGLMSREFFVREWLKARPFTYLWTHMLVMPLIDFYATACDWLVAGAGAPPRGLGWFVAASFFNGIVIELGRKIRAPEDEEEGVETYTVVWGRAKAVGAWVLALSATLACAAGAAAVIGVTLWVSAVLALILLAALALAMRFLAGPRRGMGRRFETASGVWTLALYLGLGVLPLLLP
ncbi:membrane protein [Sulfurifustis variabilis]|uniref:Membrane protein n=1 Tax=Sulfurifustis variabilis TaxID=1675686 RepID=A0A1C7AFU9_9GAMM|nr:UbiA family prenyltransferase [Sulfurifustis variabilis]BAU50283.1 membrane protein [Sulfurifustis variabilis]